MNDMNIVPRFYRYIPRCIVYNAPLKTHIGDPFMGHVLGVALIIFTHLFESNILNQDILRKEHVLYCGYDMIMTY